MAQVYETVISEEQGYINSWYVFHVRSGEEVKARDNLISICERKDIKLNFVIPTAIKFIKKEKQRIKSFKTVFPGYVFANGIIDVEIYNILKGIPGVYRLLRDRSTFTLMPVPAEEMELLAGIMNVYGVIEAPEVSFEEGQTAVITKGPLTSFKGRIVAVDKHKNKLTLLVPFLGEERRVEIGFLFAESVNQEVIK
ncbi:MAG: transcription termination/antitermination NusG family protein [Clostridia bacterium]